MSTRKPTHTTMMRVAALGTTAGEGRGEKGGVRRGGQGGEGGSTMAQGQGAP